MSRSRTVQLDARTTQPAKNAGTALSPRAGILQSKLVVGSVHDPLEHEADRMADRVMGISAPPSSGGEPPATPGSGGGVQRKRTSCAAAAPSASTMAAPPLVHEVLASQGAPLDAGTRDFMETRFNHDFSHVRVHAGAAAEESARQVYARAYTVGHSIVFGAGHYAPATSGGRRLLAHELAHTVQQENVAHSVVQRSEVDDDPHLCEDLDDIESELDARVNRELDRARTAAGAGFEKDPGKVQRFLGQVALRLGEGKGKRRGIEDWLRYSKSKKVKAKRRKLSVSDSKKYGGTETLNSDPAHPVPVPGEAGELGAVLKVAGICVGSDKLGHFFKDGWGAYHAQSPEAAKLFASDDEIGGQGLGISGVYSNADIVADLAGRDFYSELHDNPLQAFAIKKFINPQWNEYKNPNYYTGKVGKVVWRNLLVGDWGGSARYAKKHEWFANVSFWGRSLDGTREVFGDYTEKRPGGEREYGRFEGSARFQTAEVKGSTGKEKPVSGIQIDVELKMEAGPIRKAHFESRGETELIGSWEEPSPVGGGTRHGTWHLQKDGKTLFLENPFENVPKFK
jgi:hypothetical protein